MRSWQAGYKDLLPDAYLASLTPEERAGRYTFGDQDPLQPQTLVALWEERICGFATTMPAPVPDQGELAGLYVDPDHWGRGIGTRLLTEARSYLALRGFSRAGLWVLSGNTRAQRFYARDGWRPDGVTRGQRIWGIDVQEVSYTRRLP